MTKTLTLEGDVTGADTATNLTTQGSITAPALSIPAGATEIKKVLVAIAPDGTGDGSAIFIVRLDGTGVLNGEQAIVVSAAGAITVQAGADPTGMRSILFELDNAGIAVSPGNTIRVQAEMCGDDLGAARAVVTVVFA